MTSRKGSGTLVCFVGNIPYDTTEEQIVEIFNTVGPVQAFRLVFDRETGKPKGYGFCEFHDHETAASAVRNLNNYDMGGRTLRVDFAENEKPGGPSREREDGARGAAGSSTFQQSPQYGGPASGAQPGMAYGAPPPSAGGGIGVQDPAVAKALALFTNEQLMELMSQMKVLATNNPVQARGLLEQTPPLAYALFQIMLATKLIDPAVIGQQQQGAAMPMAAPVGFVPPATQQPFAPQQPVPGMIPPAMPGYGVAPPIAAPIANPETAAMLQQVLVLTAEQINMLPPEQRNTILQLRASMGIA